MEKIYEMKLIALASAFCVTAVFVNAAQATGATKYSSIVKMAEEVGDYPPDSGRFKVVARRPLHIQVMPFGFVNDTSRIAESRVHMVAVETLYRAFIHTSVDKITVTILPKTVVPEKPEAGEFLTDFRVTITATRQQAHALLNQYFPGKDFDDLVDNDVKSKLFDRMTFPDQGEPGVEKVFADLAQQSH
jgi:hypothetical protein